MNSTDLVFESEIVDMVEAQTEAMTEYIPLVQ